VIEVGTGGATEESVFDCASLYYIPSIELRAFYTLPNVIGRRWYYDESRLYANFREPQWILWDKLYVCLLSL